jgi:PhnB protein
MPVNPIPEGFHTVTPCLTVSGGVEALSFYGRAFGAETLRKLVLDGKLMHSEVRIGNSIVCFNDPFPEYGSAAPDGEALPAAMMLYVEDVDAWHARALAAGATELTAPNDTFHGDRASSVRDPYGHRWMIVSRIEELSEEELQRRTEEAMAAN